jgi:predicted GIY-YIG superfamily endonuclease
MERSCFVYGLHAGTAVRPFYLGASSDPRRRLREHLYNARHGRAYQPNLSARIRDLLAAGNTIRVVVIEGHATKASAHRREELLTRRLMSAGADLVNEMTGTKPSAAMITKFTAGQIATKRVPDVRRRLRAIQHAAGLRGDNSSGHKGVSWYKARAKWGAKIYSGGRPIFLGLFARLEDAIAARKAGERQHWRA